MERVNLPGTRKPRHASVTPSRRVTWSTGCEGSRINLAGGRPMPKFSFSDHRLDTRCWLKCGKQIETHTLELRGLDEDSGAINNAILIFDPGADLTQARQTGTVGYMTRKPAGGISLVGWLPLTEFPAFMRVLNCGDPLSVHFVLRDPRSGVGYVRRLGVGHYEKILSATICRKTSAGPRPSAEIYALPV